MDVVMQQLALAYAMLLALAIWPFCAWLAHMMWSGTIATCIGCAVRGTHIANNGGGDNNYVAQ
jgi:hypothetical protein